VLGGLAGHAAGANVVVNGGAESGTAAGASTSARAAETI